MNHTKLAPTLPMNEGKSTVVIDPKGQLAAMTAAWRYENGNDVQIIDPFGPLKAITKTSTASADSATSTNSTAPRAATRPAPPPACQSSTTDAGDTADGPFPVPETYGDNQ